MSVDRRKVLKGGAAVAGATAFVGPLNAFAKNQIEGLPQLGHVPESANPAGGKSGKEAIDAWMDYLQPSSLSKEAQRKELEFFVEKGEQFSGMTINAVSESTGTHKFESNVLTKAFEDLTGITVKHDLMGEGKTVSKFLTEAQTHQDIYDIFTIDSDFIGTVPRLEVTHTITDYMQDNDDITLPSLDLDDFIGKDWVTWPGDNKVYQLPQGQFANLYWYRKDWFDRPDLKQKFKNEYGYELNVPVNWAAYEDIADFFTNKVKHIDGKRVYGHMDYGKKGPSIGWRIHDSWLSMAGMSDKGLPFGRPVNDWGIRIDDDMNPVGSMVERGGAVNGPAAVYAIEKYVSWLKKYAPPEATGLTFYSAGPVPAKGHVAQQIFWYSAFTSSLTDPSLPVVNDDGTPKWRMAPSPHGPYWEPGMKVGYQDMGSWTMPKYTPKKKMKAAWLYAQFTTCKAISGRKLFAALTPFRKSDVDMDAMTKAAPYLGGLVEFYRSPAVKYWTPTGTGVPHYAKLAPIWWKNVAPAVTGDKSAQEAMDSVGEKMDQTMARLSKAGVLKKAPPKLNPKKSKDHWLEASGAPKPKVENENPKGKTKPYEELLKAFDDPDALSG
ncbi:carbohydrate ABC transporter substrate-binding protein [Salinisphaera sp. USBA-960]|nr:carbohydrate ABC transporter substrate-binding protein [Salifodinibacter halophilus]NNC26849.1 carbohydrate ABC transporter substrate-binding protein [Salifodinibacter halophilus]